MKGHHRETTPFKRLPVSLSAPCGILPLGKLGDIGRPGFSKPPIALGPKSQKLGDVGRSQKGYRKNRAPIVSRLLECRRELFGRFWARFEKSRNCTNGGRGLLLSRHAASENEFCFPFGLGSEDPEAPSVFNFAACGIVSKWSSECGQVSFGFPFE